MILTELALDFFALLGSKRAAAPWGDTPAFPAFRSTLSLISPPSQAGEGTWQAAGCR